MLIQAMGALEWHPKRVNIERFRESEIVKEEASQDGLDF
jgi:hypothetical protein